MNRMRLAQVAASLLVLAAAVPEAVAEQDLLKQAEKLNKTAMEDYDSLEFDSARQTLLSAIAKLRDAGQDDTPTAAKIYTNLGIVYIAGFKDKNRGLQQFVNALKIDGTIVLDPERATPELQEAFEAAQKQVPARKPAKPPVADTDGGPAASNVQGLQHAAIDEAKAGVDVPVKAQLGSDVAASRLFLFYRSPGQEEYVSVPMNVNAQGDWIGTIPGEAMEGKSVQYYIEARDARGRPVIAAGTAASPYIISVLEEKVVQDNDNRDNPLIAKPPVDGDKGKKDNALGRGFGRMFVNVMFGTSMGLEVSGNTTEVAYQYQTSTGKYAQQAIDGTGTALEPLHMDMELGVNITKHLGISGMVRTGFTLLNNADSSAQAMDNPAGIPGTAKASGDVSGFLRLRYLFLEDRVRPLLHLGLGFGSIRHLLDIHAAENDTNPLVDAVSAQYFNSGQYAQDYQAWASHGMKGTAPRLNEVCPDHNNCVDTVALGMMFVSAGGGLYVDLTKWKNGGFGLLVDVDAILALPVGGGQTGLNFDFQVGLGTHFL